MVNGRSIETGFNAYINGFIDPELAINKLRATFGDINCKYCIESGNTRIVGLIDLFKFDKILSDNSIRKDFNLYFSRVECVELKEARKYLF